MFRILTSGPAGGRGRKGDKGNPGDQGDPGNDGVDGDWSSAQTITETSFTVNISTVVPGRLYKCVGGTTIVVGTTHSFTAGQRVDFARWTSDAVTFEEDGASIFATPGLTLRAFYSGATLMYMGSDNWWLTGDLDV